MEAQKKAEGEACITTVLFDDQYAVLHNGLNIGNVAPITEKEYFARGMTALLDAVGKTIINTDIKIGSMADNERPSKVIFVITTDALFSICSYIPSHFSVQYACALRIGPVICCPVSADSNVFRCGSRNHIGTQENKLPIKLLLVMGNHLLDDVKEKLFAEGFLPAGDCCQREVRQVNRR